MKFQKHVKREKREYLTQQLKEYEAETQMSKEERLLLHNWVSSGRSPYENGDYIYGAGGPLDFISAHRTMREIMDNPEEISDIDGEIPVQYDTTTDDIMLEINRFPLPDLADEDLPFQ